MIIVEVLLDAGDTERALDVVLSFRLASDRFDRLAFAARRDHFEESAVSSASLRSLVRPGLLLPFSPPCDIGSIVCSSAVVVEPLPKGDMDAIFELMLSRVRN